MNRELLKKLPKVDKLLLNERIKKLIEETSLEIVKNGVREVIEDKRKKILSESIEKVSIEDIVEEVISKSREKDRYNLRALLNGTGTIIHTNLGRAPLSKEAVRNILEVSKGYNNLEYDLESGSRGSRYNHLEEKISKLTGSEGAIVVNNNAGAVLLVLDEFGREKDVVVSRGELVEIGGSFRIPKIMKISRCNLVEVGSTNRTHIEDYEEVIGEETALLVKVHTSNYRMVGFTKEVSTRDLCELGKRKEVKVVEDLGSGMIYRPSVDDFKREKTVKECLDSGVDLVTFSGDKLLGGPQCGIILGKKELIDKIRKNQMLRALRVSKLTIAALEGTLKSYENKNYHEIPVIKMIEEDQEVVKKRADHLVDLLKKEGIKSTPKETLGAIGGGSMPGTTIKSYGVVIEGVDEISFDRKLRLGKVPVIGLIRKESYIIDMKCIEEGDIPLLVEMIKTSYFS